jgi:hypothetical protein
VLNFRKIRNWFELIWSSNAKVIKETRIGKKKQNRNTNLADRTKRHGQAQPVTSVRAEARPRWPNRSQRASFSFFVYLFLFF